MTVRVSIGEFGAVLRKRIADDTAKLQKTAVDELAAAVPVARAMAAAEGIDDLGGYSKGWRVVPVPGGAELRNDAPHAAIVEYGRLPGKPPPVRLLRGWVSRKLGIDGPEADRVAFLVARRIGEEGIRPRFILRNLWAGLRLSWRGRALRTLRR